MGWLDNFSDLQKALATFCLAVVIGWTGNEAFSVQGQLPERVEALEEMVGQLHKAVLASTRIDALEIRLTLIEDAICTVGSVEGMDEDREAYCNIIAFWKEQTQASQSANLRGRSRQRDRTARSPSQASPSGPSRSGSERYQREQSQENEPRP